MTVQDDSIAFEAPGRGEGQVVGLDLADPRDIGLLRQAIRRGWIKSLSRMDALVEQAIDAVSGCQGIDPLEVSKLKVALGRLGAAAASVYVRSVQTAEGRSEQHLHLHGDVANMSTHELRAYIAAQLGSRPDGAREPGAGTSQPV